MAKKATKAVKRPMVPTTDKMKLPNKGTVTIKVKPRAVKKEKKAEKTLSEMTKAERTETLKKAFFRDGLAPEERLLKAIYGKNCKVKATPKSKRTDEAFKQIMERGKIAAMIVKSEKKAAAKSNKAEKKVTKTVVKKAVATVSKKVAKKTAKVAKPIKKTVVKPTKKTVKAVKNPIAKKGKK